MRFGDVVLVDLPQPAGAPGHEQFGRRPAIIFQADEATPNLSTVLVVPCTSQLKAAQFAGSIVIEPSSENGLTLKTVALTHQLRAIDKRRIATPRLGTLADDHVQAIRSNLQAILNI
ncbi:MAG: hypothetical protein CMJ58_21460 [Planctomycetaceae bacterium]|nr:hypothetical protein [Planctomycetaceae bacterium]